MGAISRLKSILRAVAASRPAVAAGAGFAFSAFRIAPAMNMAARKIAPAPHVFRFQVVGVYESILVA
jgi:hypothetical protein